MINHTTEALSLLRHFISLSEIRSINNSGFLNFFAFDLRAEQTQNAIKIKIVEITPKLHFIGANIEETIQLQREHEQIHRKLQV